MREKGGRERELRPMHNSYKFTNATHMPSVDKYPCHLNGLFLILQNALIVICNDLFS